MQGADVTKSLYYVPESTFVDCLAGSLKPNEVLQADMLDSSKRHGNSA